MTEEQEIVSQVIAKKPTLYYLDFKTRNDPRVAETLHGKPVGYVIVKSKPGLKKSIEYGVGTFDKHFRRPSIHYDVGNGLIGSISLDKVGDNERGNVYLFIDKDIIDTIDPNIMNIIKNITPYQGGKSKKSRK